MIKDLIKQLRINKGYTQKKLASLLSVASYTISDWEQGRADPDIESIKKLCVIFDITADELLEIETNAQRKEININNSFNNNTNTKIDIKN